MNFEDLKALKSMAVNSTNNGVAFREITTEELKDAFYGETIEYMSTMVLKDDASVAQQVAHKMAQLAENDCDGSEDLGKLLVSKIMSVAERAHEAKSKGNDVGIANAQATAQGICTFIKRLQNGIGRNSYYRTLEAERYEVAGADVKFDTRSSYDGFQHVKFDPSQVADVADEVYDELSVAYGYALGLCSDYIISKMSTFPFAALSQGDGSFIEYMDRTALHNALRDNKASTSAVAKEALSLI